MPPATPRSVSFRPDMISEDEVPTIDADESFNEVVSKLIIYVSKAVDAAYTWEQLRTSFAGQRLQPLIGSLSDDCHHQAIVAALIAARYALGEVEGDGSGINQSRALACEFVAWQFLTYLSERELMDYLLYELPKTDGDGPSTPTRLPNTRIADANGTIPQTPSRTSHETAPLLQPRPTEYDSLVGPARSRSNDNEAATVGESSSREQEQDDDDLGKTLAGMNALEIALVCDAKKFIASRPVQKVVTDVWSGDIVFWESMSVRAVKKATVYKKRSADPFLRLRVPKYQKAAQSVYFVLFLALYYIVLVARNPQQVNFSEVLLYVWILAFAYDEFGEIQDAGLMLYRTDFWSLWDLGILGLGIAFFVTRIVGLMKQDSMVTDTAFDILSMVALFLVPRIFSMFSLNPYFGSLIPVLKEMTKAFCKFLPVIIVLYLGFLTTFSMLARDRLSVNEMSWLLIKVFFGSSYLGFDVAVTISPLFGYTLMLIFVLITNILLLTSLVSLVSNSLTEVMAHAREEYLFQYSIYVLESSTSGRLTYFMPPLNLISLFILRPLRLLLPSEDARRIRIVVLKATHAPLVGLIWVYESLTSKVQRPSSIIMGRDTPKRPLSGQPGVDTPKLNLNSSPLRTAVYARKLQRTSSTHVRLRSTSSTTDQAELIALVQSLSAKVDDLASMIAGQNSST